VGEFTETSGRRKLEKLSPERGYSHVLKAKPSLYRWVLKGEKSHLT
jgi:hypothetical protein